MVVVVGAAVLLVVLMVVGRAIVVVLTRLLLVVLAPIRDTVVVVLGRTVVLVVLVVVVARMHAPVGWQPSPTLVALLSGQMLPPILAHVAAFITLLALRLFFGLQQTTKPGRAQVDCRMKRLMNSLLQTPVSRVAAAFLAFFRYSLRLVAVAHGATASTASATAPNPDVSLHVLAASAGAAISAARSTTPLRARPPILDGPIRRGSRPVLVVTPVCSTTRPCTVRPRLVSRTPPRTRRHG